MTPRANDTLRVTFQAGEHLTTRIARVAHDGSLFGADSKAIETPLTACSWQYATLQERRDFDECLRDHLVPPPMSVVVRRRTMLATVAPAATPGLQARAWGRYSFVDPSRRRTA